MPLIAFLPEHAQKPMEFMRLYCEPCDQRPETWCFAPCVGDSEGRTADRWRHGAGALLCACQNRAPTGSSSGPCPPTTPSPSTADVILGFRPGLQPMDVATPIQMLLRKASEWKLPFAVFPMDVRAAFDRMRFPVVAATLRAQGAPA